MAHCGAGNITKWESRKRKKIEKLESEAISLKSKIKTLEARLVVVDRKYGNERKKLSICATKLSMLQEKFDTIKGDLKLI